jgi:hypothetical protein
MTTAPDWVRVGETAYVLTDNNVTGVGSYDTVTKVEITFVGVRDIRVKPHGVADHGNETRFRIADLTAPGTGGTYTLADRLVEPGDPRVRQAEMRAHVDRVVTAATAVLNNRAIDLNRTRTLITADAETIDDLLFRVEKIRDAAAEAHRQLSAARDLL